MLPEDLFPIRSNTEPSGERGANVSQISTMLFIVINVLQLCCLEMWRECLLPTFPVIVCQTLKNRAALLAKYSVLSEVSCLVFCTTSKFKNLKKILTDLNLMHKNKVIQFFSL